MDATPKEESKPTPSPNSFATYRKLEAIFLSATRKVRDATYHVADHDGSAEFPIVRFVHYTSAEAAFQVIEKRRVWMRNACCMKDFAEVEHGLGCISKFITSGKSQKLMAALDKCSKPGFAAECMKRFVQFGDGIRYHTYITSFSHYKESGEAGVRLSMMEKFKGESKSPSVAMVLNVPAISTGAPGFNAFFSPVLYLNNTEVDQLFDEAIANVEKNGEFIQSCSDSDLFFAILRMFLHVAVAIKRKDFIEEEEWRLIICPTVFPAPHAHRTFKIVSGIPQIVYELPLEFRVSPDFELSRLFDRIIIGQNVYQAALKSSFEAVLMDAGVWHPKVLFADLSLRP